MTKVKNDRITQAMEYALSQTPAQVGRRLRSEIELASLFKIGRWRVRSSIEQLVEKGVLVRRKGSGTYVRKIPEMSATGKAELSADVKSISPEVLLADPTEARRQVARLQPRQDQRQLHLELWGDLHVPSASVTTQIIMAGIVGRANEVRHHLTVHSLVRRAHDPFSVPEICQRLRDNPCDGYLVAERWADLFVEAMHKLGQQHVPAIFFCHGSCPIRQEPFIMSDTNEAIARAVRILAKDGFRRIALIGMNKPEGELLKLEQATYDNAMAQVGLAYRGHVLTDLGIGPTGAAVQQLLSRPDPPDALYVADDHVLDGVTEALLRAGRMPGRDLGVITFSNKHGLALPAGYTWSRMEFDPEQLGQLLVDSLLKTIQTTGAQVSTMSLHGCWQPGWTHQRTTL